MPPINANVTSNQITASVSEDKIDATVSGGFGPSGAAGAAATITVGTVTTGAPGTSASVVNAGTSSAAVLNFTIPAGAAGATGPQGPAGPAGTTTWAGITDKPTFATVATSGLYSDLTGTPSPYSLPTASASVLGGVKIGSGISIDGNGVISASAGYTLPVATSSVLGGVKQGSNVTIDGDGVISVAAPFSGSYTDLTNKPTLFSGSYADLTNKPSTFAPTAHASSHAAGGSDALAAADIGAADITHSHGNLGSNGTLGKFGGLIVVTGTGGAITTASSISSSQVSGLGSLATASTVPFSSVTSTPTTLAGYGITDAAAVSHEHSASAITSGTLATARLGSGTADATTFLRGDGAWATPAGGTPTVASPSQITSNQNDYAGATADFNRLSSDAARDITGFSGGTDGKTLVLVNVGSNTITLKHQSTSSTAANRIIVPWAADYILAADGAAVLVYDNTTSRWRVI